MTDLARGNAKRRRANRLRALPPHPLARKVWEHKQEREMLRRLVKRDKAIGKEHTDSE